MTILFGLAAIAAASVFLPAGNAVTPAPKTIAGARRHIVLPGRTDTLPYSDGVLVGNTLYLAGRIGVDPQTGKPPEDIEKEIRLLLDGMKTSLKAADLTMDDLVSVQVYCPDLALYEKFNEVYRTYFTKNFPPVPSSDPARSCVGGASRCRELLSGARAVKRGN